MPTPAQSRLSSVLVPTWLNHLTATTILVATAATYNDKAVSHDVWAPRPRTLPSRK